MGKVDYFAVEFYGGKKTFYPGESISGILHVKVNKELKLRGIRMEFHGKAKVHWTETHSSSSGSNSTTHYRNSETYIDTLMTLYGKGPGQSGDNPVLQAGNYTFPFEFRIPNKKMPSSVEAKHGHVRYWLKGIIDRPWKFDITTTAVFTLLEYVDINTLVLQQPCQVSEDRMVGCCCETGPLSVTVSTDRGGYCPGESIGISAVINNSSENEVFGLDIQLIQITTFTASPFMSFEKQKRREENVAFFRRGGVPPGEQRHMPTLEVPVPSLPPTMLSCKCMRIIYVLKLKVRVAGAFNSNLSIPITIGSVPYRPPITRQHPQPSAPAAFADPTPPGFSDSAAGYPEPYTQYGTENTQPYPDMPPPSYAACVSGGATITNDEGDSSKAMGDSTFTPMYPFVNNCQFPSAPPPTFSQDAASK